MRATTAYNTPSRVPTAANRALFRFGLTHWRRPTVQFQHRHFSCSHCFSHRELFVVRERRERDSWIVALNQREVLANRSTAAQRLRRADESLNGGGRDCPAHARVKLRLKITRNSDLERKKHDSKQYSITVLCPFSKWRDLMAFISDFCLDISLRHWANLLSMAVREGQQLWQLRMGLWHWVTREVYGVPC